MLPHFNELIISDIRRETEDAVSIAFYIPENLAAQYQFEVGQYLTLKTIINGEEIRRSYSICSCPHEQELRVAIKEIEDGVFSSYANQTLQIGDRLEVMTPSGSFTHHKADNGNYVFFAVGSGITPIISMIKHILKDEAGSKITLFYGNKGFYSVIFREELEALKNTYMDRLSLIHVFSRESLGNRLQKGRIDTEKVNELYHAFLKGVAIDQVYLCGPIEMINSVKESLVSFGVAKEKINFELFGVTASAAPKKQAYQEINANVVVILDGDNIDLSISDNQETILEAAHKAGADLPFACKGGVCCTCKAKIIEGSASMDVNYALEPDEVAAGYILTCQAHPTSDKLVVSFDE